MAINSKGKITKAQLSQSLIDELLAAAGSNSGGGSVAIKKYSKTITANTDRVYIGNGFFDINTDQLLVFKNSVYLELNEDYMLNQNDCTISPLTGVWEATSEEPDTFNFICLMNTPGDVFFSGSKLLNATVTEDKLSPEVQEKLNTRGGSSSEEGVFHSYIETIYITGWSSTTNPDGMYTKTVTHGLNCSDNLIVSAIDTDSKRNIAVSYRVTGLNTIEVESDKKVNMKLMIINSNEAEIVVGTPGVGGEDLYSKTITKSMWTTEQDMMVCNINHSLNTQNVILSTYDTDTGLNIMVSYKIVDNNTIQLRSNQSYNCKVVLTYKTITNTTTSSSQINDDVVSTKSTYSSDKINKELTKVNEKFNNIITYNILPSEVGVIDTRYIYGDVRRYGAVGDGITDNTQAFENCINSLGSEWSTINNTMYIPQGAWKISKPIIINRNNMTLKGEGIEQTILLPQNCKGIEVQGSTSNTRYGVVIKDFAINGGTDGFDGSYLGLNCSVSNISIHSTTGYGYYLKSAFDHVIENVICRGCGNLGFFVDQIDTSGEYEEVSYITFNNCVAVDCNNNQTQWKIKGNNIFLNNCKANEGNLGIEFIGEVWACRVTNFYMDGVDTNSVMFKVNSVSARNITFENTYGWNIGYVIQASSGRSIIGRNLDINPSYWAYKAVKIDDSYTGVVDLDNKNYVIEDNRTEKKPYVYFGDFSSISGQRILVKEVELDMYTGGGEFTYEYNGDIDEQIQNVFVTPMNDIRYTSRDGAMAGQKCVPLIYTETNKQGYFYVKILCDGAVREKVVAKLQLMIILKPTKPYQ